MPKVPRDLETICLKCLQKEPHKRYVAASALAEDLDRFLSGQPIAARPTGVWERVVKWARRRPAAAALVVVLMFAWIAPVVTGLIFNAYAQRHARGAKKANEDALKLVLDLETARNQAAKDREAARLASAEAERDRAAAKVERERADIASKRIGKDIYVADLRLAQKAWDEARIGRVLELLDGQHPERTVGVDLRGFEWHYLKRLCHTELFTLQAPNGFTGGFWIAYSPDGTRLVTCGSSSVLRTWDAATGRELHDFKGHSRNDAVWRAVFSPDSKWIASGTGEFGNAHKGEVKLWDADTGKLVRDLQTEGGAITGLAFNADGTRLAAATGDKMIKVWDPASGELVHKMPTQRKVTGISYSSAANQLAWCTEYNTSAGNSAGDVVIMDMATSKYIGGATGYLGRLNGVSFSPDGKRIAACGDMGVKIWNVGGGDEMFFRGEAPGYGERGVTWSPDGKRLAAGSFNQIKIWDLATGQELNTIKGHLSYILSVAFSPDGKRIASTDGTPKVWDSSKGHEPLTVPGELGRWFNGIAFEPGGKELAVATGNGPIWLLDPATGKKLRTLEGHKNWAVALAYSADGKRLASASVDQTARVWDAATGKEINKLEDDEDGFNGIALSPDGRLIATGSGVRYTRVGEPRRRHGQVKLWDAVTGKPMRTLRINTADKERPLVTSVAFSHDGKWLAAGLTQYGRPVANPPTGHPPVQFYSGAVAVFDVATGQEVALLADSQEVHSVVFSRDSAQIACGGNNGWLKIWNTATWMERFNPKGHTEEVNGVAFSPDGKRVASVSRDNTVRLWDTATGQEILTLRGEVVMGVAFSPSGNRIAATGPKLRIWDATPRE